MMMTAIGLMSGTSLDGVDVALIETDGKRVKAFGPSGYRPYTDGERGLLRQAKSVIAQRRSIVIFPEGTRVAPGDQKPYQIGTAALYRQLGVPVVPVALNSGLFWGRRKFVKRPGVITLEILPPIAPGLDRETFMATLRERIETATARLAATVGREPTN